MTTTTPNIIGRAMLANVSLGVWEARKHDRVVTKKVNDQHAAGQDAGRYHKRLFGGAVPVLSAVITAAGRLRLTHHTQTLPWGETGGWRLLPTDNHSVYSQAIRVDRRTFEEKVDALVEEYPRLVRQARERLNGMYRAEDYPTAAEVRAKYWVSVDYSPLPVGGDFRLSLPKAEMERMVKEVEARVERAVETAMVDAWTRLGDVVTDLRDRLDDGKYLRESLIERVQAVAESLGRLNVTQDVTLEKTRKQVLLDLATLDVKAVRSDEAVRGRAAASADAILKQMKSVYSPTKGA